MHHKEFVLAVCKAISIFKPMLCKRLRSSLKTCHRQLFSPFGVALILTPFSFSCCSQQKRREKPRLFLVHHKEFVLAVCKAISIFKPMLCKRLRSSLKTCHRQLFSPFGVALILTPFSFSCSSQQKRREKPRLFLVHHKEFESLTFGSVDRRSIQLS